MTKNKFDNQISDEAIVERSFSFCNDAMHTITLQIRRLQTKESEVYEFLHRQWADLRFLLLSLDRLHKAAGIASNVKTISKDVEEARNKFVKSIPYLKKLRNVGEHFDSYSMDNGYDPNISRKSLQVGTWTDDGSYFHWLDEEIRIIECEKAAIDLFITMRDIKNNFSKNNLKTKA